MVCFVSCVKKVFRAERVVTGGWFGFGDSFCYARAPSFHGFRFLLFSLAISPPGNPSHLPRPINTPRAPHLPPSNPALPPPLLPPRTINIPTRLDRDPTPRPPRLHLRPLTITHLRNLDMLARVELKRRLRAQHLQMQARGRMAERDQFLQRQRPGV